MPNIRKTKSSTQSLRKAKKRLKREIAGLSILADLYTLFGNTHVVDNANQHIQLLKQELQHLKRKKR